MLTDQELFDAHWHMTHLEVQVGDAWLTCVTQDIRVEAGRISKVKVMIVDSRGLMHIPKQYVSKSNFGQLRKKAPPSGDSPTNVTQ